MTSYNPGTPLPFDIPADSQDEFLNNFQLINNFYDVDHIPFGNTIENATQANPCVITSTNHRLSTGNNITVYTLDGLDPEIGRQPWSINGSSFNVTVVDANTFSIPVDTTNEPPYIANTGDFEVNTAGYGYGLHRKLTLSSPVSSPNRASPIGSLFSQNVTEKTPTQEEITQLQLLFQNNINDIFHLIGTQNLVRQNITVRTPPPPAAPTVFYNVGAIGFNTPWGITVNMGRINVGAVMVQPPTSLDYPIPYTTTNFFTLGTLDQSGQLQSVNGVRVAASTLSTFQFAFNTNKSTTTAWGIWYLSMGI